MKIWCLFSIANEYDQPDNNLEAWFLSKPDFKSLNKVLGFNKSKAKLVGDLLRHGRCKDIGSADYRLEEVEEATRLKGDL